MTLILSSIGLKNINWNLEKNNFLFILNDKNLYCNIIQAEFLSKKIKNLRLIDSTIFEFKINSNFKIFEKIFNLSKGLSLIIENNIEELYEIGLFLENEEIINFLEKDFKLTKENVINKLILKFNNNLLINNEINFINENLLNINKNKLIEININILEKILFQNNKIFQNENELFLFILDLIKLNENLNFLLNNIFTELLNYENLIIYLNLIKKFNLILSSWDNLYQKLIFNNKFIRNRNYNSYPSKDIQINNEYIFKKLTELTNKNICNKGLINITVSSTNSNLSKEHNASNSPNCVVDFNTNQCWYGENNPNTWIKFEFINNSIILSKYKIQLGFGCQGKVLKWVLEGSNDNNNWKIIDNHQSDTKKYDDFSLMEFSINSTESFKYLRIDCGNTYWGGHYYLGFANIDFYGKLTKNIDKISECN